MDSNVQRNTKITKRPVANAGISLSGLIFATEFSFFMASGMFSTQSGQKSKKA